MKYTVMSEETGGFGRFSVIVSDENEALTVATRLLEHGCGVQIIGYSDGVAYDLAALERATQAGETV